MPRGPRHLTDDSGLQLAAFSRFGPMHYGTVGHRTRTYGWTGVEWLRKRGLIERLADGRYAITDKGTEYLRDLRRTEWERRLKEVAVIVDGR